jgi:hypothetical protein
MSETASQVSWDDISDSRCTSPALSVTFDDSQWDDDASSPEAKPPTSFDSEPPPTSPPTFTSSIWRSFGSGLSRLTQEINRVPSVDQSNVKLPRDNVVDGAESEMKKDSSELAHAADGGWNLPQSFRSFQPLVLSAQSPNAGIGNWTGGHSSTNVPRKINHITAADVSAQSPDSCATQSGDVDLRMSATKDVLADVESKIGQLNLVSGPPAAESAVVQEEDAPPPPPRSPLRRSVSEASIHDVMSDASTGPVHSRAGQFLVRSCDWHRNRHCPGTGEVRRRPLSCRAAGRRTWSRTRKHLRQAAYQCDSLPVNGVEGEQSYLS